MKLSKSIFSLLLSITFANAGACGDCPGCSLIYPSIVEAANSITNDLIDAENEIADALKEANEIKAKNRILTLEIAKVKRKILALQRKSDYKQTKIIYELNNISNGKGQ